MKEIVPQLIGRRSKHHTNIRSIDRKANLNTKATTPTKTVPPKKREMFDADRISYIQNETRQNPYQPIWQLTLSVYVDSLSLARSLSFFVYHFLGCVCVCVCSISSFKYSGHFFHFYPIFFLSFLLLVWSIFSKMSLVFLFREMHKIIFESWAIVAGLSPVLPSYP